MWARRHSLHGRLALLLASGILSACSTGVATSSVGTTATTVFPSSGRSIVSDTLIRVSPNTVIPLENVVAGLAGAALIYLVYDPFAPNWSIEERNLGSDTFHLSLRAKHFRTGGDGESYQILKRRALQLQRENGYTSYRILDYSEGIESSTPLTYRYSEGTVQLVRAEAAVKP